MQKNNLSRPVLFSAIKKNIHKPGVVIFLLIILSFIGAFAYVIIIGVLNDNRLSSSSKEIYYTYGQIFHTESKYGQNKASSVVDAHVIIDNRKYNVGGMYNSYKYPFKNGGFYKVRFWCKDVRCADLHWAAMPEDTAIVNEYFRKKHIDFYSTSFESDCIKASNLYGLSFWGVIKSVFSKKDTNNCVCKYYSR